MTGDRELGLKGLQFYYDSSALRAWGVDFDKFRTYYDSKSASFIENFGGAIRLSEIDDRTLQSVMSDAASYGGGNIPSTDTFFSALNNEVTRFKFENVKDAFTQAIKQTGSVVAVVGSSAAIIYVLIAVGGMFLLSAKRA